MDQASALYRLPLIWDSDSDTEDSSVNKQTDATGLDHEKTTSTLYRLPIIWDSDSDTEDYSVNKQTEATRSDHKQTGQKYERLVVAAIYFGTFRSGFALGNYMDYMKDPSKISVHTWNSGTAITNKAPTTVLINPNGRDCMSFGYDAEREFVNLEPAEQKKHYLFRQIKMQLFSNPEMSVPTKLKDVTDKELPAVDVFAAVVQFFRDNLQKQLNTRHLEDFTYDDVYWVITVPAIWDLKAKQFMRKAAEKAGLKNCQLSLALEPVAAFLYCRKIPVEISTQKDGAKQIASLTEGNKFLVLDLKGGTIDITAHEVMADSGLRELKQACGGYYGGTCVNDEIMSFFKRLFGIPVLINLKEENPGDYLDLMNEIEMNKCTYSPKMDKKNIILRLPVTLLDAYKEETECQIEECLLDTAFADDVQIKRDKMMISKKLFGSFFKSSVDNIVRIIKEFLYTPSMSEVTTFLAVGGYAESAIIKETLQTAFPEKKIVIPTDPSLSVLKGAVIYGFESEVIAFRD